MAHPIIDADECIACGVCVDACPAGVLELNDVATVADEAFLRCLRRLPGRLPRRCHHRDRRGLAPNLSAARASCAQLAQALLIEHKKLGSRLEPSFFVLCNPAAGTHHSGL